MHYAQAVAGGRHESGTPSNPDDSGFGEMTIDLIGTMAEMAVCLYYDEPYQLWVTAYDERPGAIPDLIHKGYKVSVKGRQRWDKPLDLIVPEHDVNNDIYILVSVNVTQSMCGLRGWVTLDQLLRYEPRCWQWTTNRPGAHKNGKRWRFVPVDDLRPCREQTVVAA